MRASIVLLLACLSLLAPNARADPFESYNPALTETCVAVAADRAALEVCKGAGARACIATDGPSTMSEVLCWSHEAESWDEFIAASVAILNARSPERTEALNAAHAAWLNWTDAECNYRSEPTAGGSGVQVEYARCAADLAADRAFELMEAARAQ